MREIASRQLAVARRSVPRAIWVSLWLFALSCNVSSVAAAEPATEGRDAPASEPEVQQLPPVEVTGRAPMGLKAGIACKGLVAGPVVRVTITAVTAGGRGEKLGVRRGDELITINDIPLVGKKKSEVNSLLREVSQGRTGSLEILREGAEAPLRIAWVLKGD